MGLTIALVKQGEQGAREKGDMAWCRHLHRLAVEWPAYGYRRLTHALHRQGLSVNHKRALRLMREEHLVRRRRSRVVRTTDSQHGFPLYPHLLPTVTLTGLDQLWRADMTYIRLPQDLCISR